MQDLNDGMERIRSILDESNEAIAKETRREAVEELQQRVEDWKGHKIDHFGELLLNGTYTVLKGEGAKEVEREVSRFYLFKLRLSLRRLWSCGSSDLCKIVCFNITIC